LGVKITISPVPGEMPVSAEIVEPWETRIRLAFQLVIRMKAGGQQQHNERENSHRLHSAA